MTSGDWPLVSPSGDGSLVSPSGDGVLITHMRPRHLPAVVEIEERTSHRPWSTRLFRDELRMVTSRNYLVAVRDHLVLGFCGLMVNPDEGHITTITVHPDHRRASIATRLLLVQLREAVERGIDAVTLEVRITNRAAQDLYRRFGFAPGGIRRNYYQDIREDALIMWAHDLDAPESIERMAAIEAALPVPLVEEVSLGG